MPATSRALLPHTVPPTAPGLARGWGIYARLSARKVGRAKRRRNEFETCERQIAEIRAWAARMGMVISEAHIRMDNHLSAWKEDGERPGFDDLIAAAERGEIVGIAVWKIDRFTRRVADALAFIKLAEAHGVLIDGPKSGRYDLATPDGRKKLRDDASAAEHESDTIGLRVKSRLADAQVEGLQMGGCRIFGFELLSEARKYDDDVFPIRRPAEVAILRELGRRKTTGGPDGEGETWAALAADLNKRGILTAKNNPWRAVSLAKMLTHPRYGGYIVVKGVEVGTLPTVTPDGDPNPPILDAETYARLQAMRAAAIRGPQATGKYPLTGAVRCGKCNNGRTLAGGAQSAAGRRRYVCPAHVGCGMSLDAEVLEGRVRAEVVAVAANRKVRAIVAEQDTALALAREGLRAELATVAEEIDRLDGQMSALEQRHMHEQLTGRNVRPRAYTDMKATLDGLIAKAEGRRAELAAELAEAAAADGDLPALTGADWDAMPAEDKRAMIKRLHLTVTVHPTAGAGRTGRAIRPERITIA